jgi:hypothetical protein
MKLDRLRRPKLACVPSYAVCRPKISTLILLDMGHILKEDHTKERSGREENQKLECG